MNIKEVHDEVISIHEKNKQEFVAEFKTAVSGLFSKFYEKTGCVITDVNIALLIHHSDKNVVDKYTVDSVSIKTDID